MQLEFRMPIFVIDFVKAAAILVGSVGAYFCIAVASGFLVNVMPGVGDGEATGIVIAFLAFLFVMFRQFTWRPSKNAYPGAYKSGRDYKIETLADMVNTYIALPADRRKIFGDHLFEIVSSIGDAAPTPTARVTKIVGVWTDKDPSETP